MNIPQIIITELRNEAETRSGHITTKPNTIPSNNFSKPENSYTYFQGQYETIKYDITIQNNKIKIKYWNSENSGFAYHKSHKATISIEDPESFKKIWDFIETRDR